MNYRCPHCKDKLQIAKLFFKDISACPHCGQRVVLGDFVAFLMASLALFVVGMSVLWRTSHYNYDPIISAGYALGAGITAAIVVLVLLGRAIPYRPIKFGQTTGRAPLTDSQGKTA
jgi:DNA-directed RNA polymerase subunit RPC12/RpoP